jgi:hypothetical protein
VEGWGTNLTPTPGVGHWSSTRAGQLQCSMARVIVQKPSSARVWWAQEELNLRPLPCQIQRVMASVYVGWLRIRKDRRKVAGEPRCQCPSNPTIHHDSPMVVLVPTAVGCCPSAARRTEPDCRAHNPNRLLESSQVYEP